MQTIEEFKNKFDPILEDFLNKRIELFLKDTNDPFVSDFVKYSKTLTLSGGKRLRPYIAYLMYLNSGGKDIESAMKLFVAFEVFHIFALMHDDIMDKQTKRHGVSTLHTYVLEKLKNDKRVGDIQNVANAQGVLVGDLFFSWALEIFLDNNNFPRENLNKAHDYFYKMVDEVCLGQILDIDMTTRNDASENIINEKTRLKTSRYTFVRPAQIGAHLANPNNDLDDFLERLGTSLGLAFQIQDDLLDIIGDPKVLNKNIFADIEERQHTFFTNYIFEKGDDTQKEQLKKLLGKKLEDKDYIEIKKLFTDSGAIEEGKKIIEEYLTKSQGLIKNSGLNDDSKSSFLNLISLIRKRSDA